MLVKLMDERASNAPFQLIEGFKVDFHRELPDPDTKEGGGSIATVWRSEHGGCSHHPFFYAAYVLNSDGKTIESFFA